VQSVFDSLYEQLLGSQASLQSPSERVGRQLAPSWQPGSEQGRHSKDRHPTGRRHPPHTPWAECDVGGNALASPLAATPSTLTTPQGAPPRQQKRRPTKRVRVDSVAETSASPRAHRRNLESSFRALANGEETEDELDEHAWFFEQPSEDDDDMYDDGDWRQTKSKGKHATKRRKKPRASLKAENFASTIEACTCDHDDPTKGGKVCAVCMESIYLGDSDDDNTLTRGPGGRRRRPVASCVLPCGHTFHRRCVMRWLRQQNTCPICRERCRNVQGEVLEDKNLVVYSAEDFGEDFQRLMHQTYNARCLVCNTDEREEVLLLCDRCENSAHTYCVGLSAVPEGEWLCPSCQADSRSFPDVTPSAVGTAPDRGQRTSGHAIGSLQQSHGLGPSQPCPPRRRGRPPGSKNKKRH